MMKKLFYLLPVLGMVLTGCSSEEPNSKDPVAYEAGNGFLSFNIISPVSGTRAGEYTDNGDGTTTPSNGEGIYENGTANENQVNAVRFFFFDDLDQPFGVHKHLTEEVYDSFIDWYPTNDDNTGAEPDITVEKGLRGALQLNLNIEDGQVQYPTKVVAIINPTSEITSLTDGSAAIIGPSLGTLESQVTDYKTNLTGTNFVMSNAVYATTPGTENGKKVVASTITEDNIKFTVEEAREEPVTIFVERVVARVDFTISEGFVTKEGEGAAPSEGGPITITGDDGKQYTIYPVGSYNLYRNDNDEDASVQETETLYIKFLGWNVTSVANKSRLIKEVNPKWTNKDIFGSDNPSVGPWSSTDYNRSFWALNPEPTKTGFDVQFGAFNNSNTSADNVFPATGVNGMPTPGEYTKLYIQENANVYSDDMTPDGPANPTKLIIGAQIVNKNGVPVNLTEWMGNKYYNQEAMLSQMVKALMTTNPETNGIYTKTTANGQTTWTPLDAGDLELTTEDPIGKSEDLNDKAYYVYVTLTEEALEKDWYKGQSSDVPFSTKEGNNMELLKYIRETVKYALVWNEGNTYFFNDIRHLGYNTNGDVVQEAAGAYGIVRNHIYRIVVNSITGLGCPVFKPEEIIKPEESDPAEAVLSADIKILQWRVVAQEYDMSW